MLGEDEQSRDGHRIPFESFERDPPREAHLDVVAAERLLDRRDLRSELDDKQGSCRRVPPEDIDRAAIAKDRERHLRDRDPAVALKDPDDAFAKAGMGRIEDAVEIAARQRTVRTSSASTPARIWRTVRMGIPAIRPRSNNDTSPWLTPTRWPRSI